MKRSEDEKWNIYTHLAGVIFAVLGFPLLFIKIGYQEEVSKYISLVVYAISFIFLFSSSTIYHYVTNEKRKFRWRKVDHISIYFMISGTYFPIMIEYFERDTAIFFLTIMYSFVFLGTILKIWFTGKFERASMILYIFLGWMIIFMAKTFFSSASIEVSTFIVMGGVAYTVGIYFYSKDEKKYYHAIWHVFVLLGSILHFSAVFLI